MSSPIDVARQLVRVAVRAFALALLALVVLAAVLGASAYALAGRDGSSTHAVIGACVAAVLVLLCAPLVAFERAIAVAISYAIEAAGVGKRLVAVFFDGLSLERLVGGTRAPLFELESQGHEVVDRLAREREGFVGARVQRRLLDQIVKLTLENASMQPRLDGPPLDLRARLEGEVDAQLARRARLVLSVAGTVYLVGAVALGLAVAWLLGRA